MREQLLMLGIISILNASSCASQISSDVKLALAASAGNSDNLSEKYQHQLGIEIEITPDGITPLRSEIVYGPQSSNNTHADLQVRVEILGKLDSAYSIPDPLIIRVDGQLMRLQNAKEFIYVPISEKCKVEIISISKRSSTQGGVIASERIEQLARDACRKHVEVEKCKQLLAKPAPPPPKKMG